MSLIKIDELATKNFSCFFKLSKPLIITLLPKTYLSKKIIRNANIFPQNEATLLGNISDGN